MPGDIDQSGLVDLADLNFVRNNFGELTSNIFGDLSGNGTIDLSDLNSVRNNFGETAAAIPPSPPPMRSAAQGTSADALFAIADEQGTDADWWMLHAASDDASGANVDRETWELALVDLTNPEE